METIEKIIIGVFVIIILISVGALIHYIYKDIEYNKEHPCIETRTRTICYTYDVCEYGIMVPGFCITKEETSCYEEVYCTKRK